MLMKSYFYHIMVIVTGDEKRGHNQKIKTTEDSKLLL